MLKERSLSRVENKCYYCGRPFNPRGKIRIEPLKIDGPTMTLLISHVNCLEENRIEKLPPVPRKLAKQPRLPGMDGG